MSILETLAALPQVNSLRKAQEIIAELEGRGLRIAEAFVPPAQQSYEPFWCSFADVLAPHAARLQTEWDAYRSKIIDEYGGGGG